MTAVPSPHAAAFILVLLYREGPLAEDDLLYRTEKEALSFETTPSDMVDVLGWLRQMGWLNTEDTPGGVQYDLTAETRAKVQEAVRQADDTSKTIRRTEQQTAVVA
jgi:DNA-binding PadR family transcriptional regulator